MSSRSLTSSFHVRSSHVASPTYTSWCSPSRSPFIKGTSVAAAAAASTPIDDELDWNGDAALLLPKIDLSEAISSDDEETMADPFELDWISGDFPLDGDSVSKRRAPSSSSPP